MNSKEKPSQVYLEIKKKTSERNLAYTTYGLLNSKTGNYEATFDFSQRMQQLNGEYILQIHVADINA